MGCSHASRTKRVVVTEPKFKSKKNVTSIEDINKKPENIITEQTAADPYEKVLKRHIKINRECCNQRIQIESMDFVNKEHLSIERF